MGRQYGDLFHRTHKPERQEADFGSRGCKPRTEVAERSEWAWRRKSEGPVCGLGVVVDCRARGQTGFVRLVDVKPKNR